MGWRFQRRVRIVPGVRLNFGKRGTSISFGHRGFWYTIGARGRRRATLGFPGTGLSYTTTSGGAHRPARPAPPPAPSALRGLASLAVLIFAAWVLGSVIFGR